MRLNFSKSGIGASIGVKGARLTASSRGSTYITVGRHGYYYRQTVGRHAGSPVHFPPPTGLAPQSPIQQNQQTHDRLDAGAIPTATIAELTESSNVELVQQLNDRARKIDISKLAWALCIVPIAVAVSTGQAWWYILVVIPAVLGFILNRRHKEQTTTRLVYELPETESAKFELVKQAIEHLSQSQQIWRVINETATDQRKYHAGASWLIRRTNARAGILPIPRVETNLSIIGIDVGAIKMFFLPDMILYSEDNTFGNIPYEAFSVKAGTTQFIEDASVPLDAVVVEWRWKYLNKTGGPDRRFKNNRQLPVARYGTLELISSTGLNIHLNVSSAQKAAAFANCMSQRLVKARPPLPVVGPPPTPGL
jgi:hypothetical protein